MFLRQARLIINFPGKEVIDPLKPLFSHGDLGIIMLQIVLLYHKTKETVSLS